MKYIFGNCFPGVLLASLVILAGAQKTSNHQKDTDIHELARQNKITQQILQYYLHKRLGLARGNVRPPSIDDILPIPKVEDNGSGGGSNVEETNYEHIAPDDENLQSVESEQVNRIYSEGKKKYVGNPYEADESYHNVEEGEELQLWLNFNKEPWIVVAVRVRYPR